MNTILLLKNTFEKKNAKLSYGLSGTSFGRQYDVLFGFLGKTLIMTASVQIISFLNDFRLSFIYHKNVLIVV